MDTNDLMRRIRYAVSLDDADAVRLLGLGGVEASLEEAAGWRAREEEPGRLVCPDAAIAALLDGLIFERRGPPPPSRAAARESRERATRPDNNRVLKQLRIALELQTDDVRTLVLAGGGELGKGELGALFRKPGTRNYRVCGDQVLRWFLAGLARRRGG